MATILRILLVDAPSLAQKEVAQAMRAAGLRVAYRELTAPLADYLPLAAASDAVLLSTEAGLALALCGQLRRASGPELPIIMLGCSSNAENLAAACAAIGATAYLPPPVAVAEVLRLICAGLPLAPPAGEALAATHHDGDGHDDTGDDDWPGGDEVETAAEHALPINIEMPPTAAEARWPVSDGGLAALLKRPVGAAAADDADPRPAGASGPLLDRGRTTTAGGNRRGRLVQRMSRPRPESPTAAAARPTEPSAAARDGDDRMAAQRPAPDAPGQTELLGPTTGGTNRSPGAQVQQEPQTRGAVAPQAAADMGGTRGSKTASLHAARAARVAATEALRLATETAEAAEAEAKAEAEAEAEAEAPNKAAAAAKAGAHARSDRGSWPGADDSDLHEDRYLGANHVGAAVGHGRSVATDLDGDDDHHHASDDEAIKPLGAVRVKQTLSGGKVAGGAAERSEATGGTSTSRPTGGSAAVGSAAGPTEAADRQTRRTAAAETGAVGPSKATKSATDRSPEADVWADAREALESSDTAADVEPELTATDARGAETAAVRTLAAIADRQPMAARGPVQRPRRPPPAPIMVPLEPAQGTLSARHDVAAVLAAAILQGVTGRIDLVGDGEHRGQMRQLFCEGGMPVGAAGADEGARLEEVLRRQGKLTAAQYRALRAEAPQSAREMAARLVAEGVLKPEELYAAVRAHLVEQVVGPMAWEAGTYAYQPATAAAAERIVLEGGAAALLLEGVRRKYDMPRLLTVLGGISSMVDRRAEAHEVVQVLGLNEAQAAIVGLLDGEHTLEDVALATGEPNLAVCQLAFVLVLLRLAQVTVLGLAQAGTTPEAEAIDRARIHEKYDHVCAQDYFEILGVGVDASDYEVDTAYASLAEAFATRRYPVSLQTELKRQLVEIAEVLEDAHLVLRDRRRRHTYASQRLMVVQR